MDLIICITVIRQMRFKKELIVYGEIEGVPVKGEAGQC